MLATEMAPAWQGAPAWHTARYGRGMPWYGMASSGTAPHTQRAPAWPAGLLQAELRELEQQHRVYDLYCWLAQRMPRAFTAGAAAQALRAQCAEFIRQASAGRCMHACW